VWILVAVLALGLVGFVVWRRSRSRSSEKSLETVSEPSEGKPVEKEPLAAAPGPVDLGHQLKRTRGALFERLGKFWGKGQDPFTEKQWEELEEVLLEADVGYHTTSFLIDKVKERNKSNSNGQDLREMIREECISLFPKAEQLGIFDKRGEGFPKPFVISIVGVNGVGKTTTIGKIAHRLKDSGRSVLMGAADTFRAGAISQLKIWAERVDAQLVAGRENADPGAVAFDSVQASKARGIDVTLLDTAGRLHTKTNLMEELKKIHRVVKKVIPEAPHETWLVLDGTLGQNSLQQAREFCKALEVTGVIVTKLDGTAKGGALLAVASELKLPVRFIGVGEAVEELLVFESGPFLDAIL